MSRRETVAMQHWDKRSDVVEREVGPITLYGLLDQNKGRCCYSQGNERSDRRHSRLAPKREHERDSYPDDVVGACSREPRHHGIEQPECPCAIDMTKHRDIEPMQTARVHHQVGPLPRASRQRRAERAGASCRLNIGTPTPCTASPRSRDRQPERRFDTSCHAGPIARQAIVTGPQVARLTSCWHASWTWLDTVVPARVAFP